MSRYRESQLQVGENCTMYLPTILADRVIFFFCYRSADGVLIWSWLITRTHISSPNHPVWWPNYTASDKPPSDGQNQEFPLLQLKMSGRMCDLDSHHAPLAGRSSCGRNVPDNYHGREVFPACDLARISLPPLPHCHVDGEQHVA